MSDSVPQPLVTVVVANYNGARFIGRTIESVLTQTWRNLALIVVDNASTDDSRDVVRSFDDPRLALAAFTDHVSVTENWNRALELVPDTGYCSLLHSDDIWYPTFVEDLAHALEATPDAWVALCNTDVIDDADRSIPRSTYVRKQRSFAGRFDEQALERLLCEMDVFPCSWLARPELAREMRFDTALTRAPDWDFWIRVFAAPQRVLSVPKVLCGYRIHSNNDTFNARTLRGMRDDELRIIEAALARTEVSDAVRRNAFRMVDTRTAIRTVQVLMRRDLRTAATLVADAIRARGFRATTAGWWTLVRLPEVRVALRGSLRSAWPRSG